MAFWMGTNIHRTRWSIWWTKRIMKREPNDEWCAQLAMGKFVKRVRGQNMTDLTLLFNRWWIFYFVFFLSQLLCRWYSLLEVVRFVVSCIEWGAYEVYTHVRLWIREYIYSPSIKWTMKMLQKRVPSIRWAPFSHSQAQFYCFAIIHAQHRKLCARRPCSASVKWVDVGIAHPSNTMLVWEWMGLWPQFVYYCHLSRPHGCGTISNTAKWCMSSLQNARDQSDDHKKGKTKIICTVWEYQAVCGATNIDWHRRGARQKLANTKNTLTNGMERIQVFGPMSTCFLLLIIIIICHYRRLWNKTQNIYYNKRHSRGGDERACDCLCGDTFTRASSPTT